MSHGDISHKCALKHFVHLQFQSFKIYYHCCVLVPIQCFIVDHHFQQVCILMSPDACMYLDGVLFRYARFLNLDKPLFTEIAYLCMMWIPYHCHMTGRLVYLSIQELINVLFNDPRPTLNCLISSRHWRVKCIMPHTVELPLWGLLDWSTLWITMMPPCSLAIQNYFIHLTIF